MNSGNPNMNHQDDLALEDMCLSLEQQRSTIQAKVKAMEELLSHKCGAELLETGHHVQSNSSAWKLLSPLQPRLELRSLLEQQISNVQSKISVTEKFLDGN